MKNTFDPRDPSLAALVNSAEDPHLGFLRERLAVAEEDNLRLKESLQWMQKQFYRACNWRDLWAWAFCVLLASLGIVGGLLWMSGWR